MGGFFSPSTTIGGSVLAPSIPLSAASLTGLYQLPGFDGLGIAVNALEYFQITNAGMKMGYKPPVAFGVVVNATTYAAPSGGYAGNGSPVISPDGRFFYSCTALVGQGYISVRARNFVTGFLTDLSGSPFITGIGLLPSEITISPDGKHLYIAASAATSIALHTINQSSGVPSFVISYGIAGVIPSTSPGCIQVTPDGLHVLCATTNNIHVFSRDANTGALVNVIGSPFASGGTTVRGIKITSDGRFVFAANSTTNNLSAFARNPVTGSLTPLVDSPYAVGTSPYGVNITPDDAFVYVNNSASNNISAFSIDASSGALTAIAGSPFGCTAGTRQTSISSDGTQLIASGNGISAYTLTPTTGFITPIAGSPFAIAGGVYYWITFSPDDLFIYLCAQATAGPIYLANTSTAPTYNLLEAVYDPLGGLSGSLFVGGTLYANGLVLNSGSASFNRLTLGTPGTVSATDASLDIFGSTNAIIHAHNTGAQGAAAGTAIIGYAVPAGAAMLNGSRLGGFFLGGTQTVAGALGNSFAIEAFCTQNWTAAANGTRAVISVTPNGSLVRTAALSIDQDGAVTFGRTVKTAGYTVATLPAGAVGQRAYVTDAVAPAYMGALVGGGAVVCPVFHNGVAWVSG